MLYYCAHHWVYPLSQFPCAYRTSSTMHHTPQTTKHLFVHPSWKMPPETPFSLSRPWLRHYNVIRLSIVLIASMDVREEEGKARMISTRGVSRPYYPIAAAVIKIFFLLLTNCPLALVDPTHGLAFAFLFLIFNFSYFKQGVRHFFARARCDPQACRCTCRRRARSARSRRWCRGSRRTG